MNLTKKQEKLIKDYLTMSATPYIWKHVLNKKTKLSGEGRDMIIVVVRKHLSNVKALAEGI